MDYLSAVSELNYLSQIVIMLYEDPKKDPTSEDRFHVELHFSAGAITGILERNIRSYSLETTSQSIKCHSDPKVLSDRHHSQRKPQNFSEGEMIPLSQSCDSRSPSHLPAVSEESPPPGISTSRGSLGVGSGVAFSLDFDEAAPPPLVNIFSETLDDAKKKLTYLANDSPPSDKPKHVGMRVASKSDASSCFPDLCKHNHYATFHGTSNFSRGHVTMPWTPLFSTKLLTGSSSAPNLLDLDYVTAASANEKLLTCGEGIPSIRPLETLHCLLSLRQLDRFMEKVTDPSMRNFSSSSTPQSSPPSGRTKSTPRELKNGASTDRKDGLSVIPVDLKDSVMSSLTNSPIHGGDRDTVSMTSSLASILDTPPGGSHAGSRSNSPTLVGADHSFCSEGVRAPTENSPMAMDEDSSTRDSIMQLDIPSSD
jgi:inositol hexakisphosphate/diphosphoinositol-pentakisphosphate kinase